MSARCHTDWRHYGNVLEARHRRLDDPPPRIEKISDEGEYDWMLPILVIWSAFIFGVVIGASL